MASLEDAITALEGQGEGGAELAAAVLSAIDAERQKGTESRNKANNEARNLRERVKAAESISEAFKSLGFDPEGDISDPHEFADSFLAIVEKAKKGELPDGYDIRSHPDFRKVTRELQRLTDEHKSTVSERDTLKRERNHGRLRSALLKALRDDQGNEVLFGTDTVVENLLLKDAVRLTDEGDVIFVNGDSEIDFDSGIKKVLADNKTLLRNQNRPGGGSGGVEADPTKQSQQERTEHLRKLRRGDY